MEFSKYRRIGILTAAAVASLQAASMAFGIPNTETIYFSDADNGAPGTPALPQITDSNNGPAVETGAFNPSSASNVLMVTGGGQVYVPGYVNNLDSGAGYASGYVQVGGFSPPSDPVFAALKIDSNGTTLTSAQTTTLINEINPNNNPTFGADIASNVSGSFNNVFAGYDILLSFPDSFTSSRAGTGSNGQFDIGFDLSSYDGTGTGPGTLGTLTVTDVGVVPEPGCLGILTAAGWVLFPRYRRYRRA